MIATVDIEGRHVPAGRLEAQSPRMGTQNVEWGAVARPGHARDGFFGTRISRREVFEQDQPPAGLVDDSKFPLACAK